MGFRGACGGSFYHSLFQYSHYSNVELMHCVMTFLYVQSTLNSAHGEKGKMDRQQKAGWMSIPEYGMWLSAGIPVMNALDLTIAYSYYLLHYCVTYGIADIQYIP